MDRRYKGKATWLEIGSEADLGDVEFFRVVQVQELVAGNEKVVLHVLALRTGTGGLARGSGLVRY